MQDCVTGILFVSSASMYKETEMPINPYQNTLLLAQVITFNPQRNAFCCMLYILPGRRPIEYRILQRLSKQAVLTAAEPLHPQRKSLQAHCHGNMPSLPPPKSLTLLEWIRGSIIIPQHGTGGGSC